MIFRVQRATNYTKLNNIIFQDNKLSLPAIGLLCYLLSKHDEWEVIPRVLCEKLNKKANSKASYYYILEVLIELEDAGYVQKKRNFDGSMSYNVFDEPNFDFTNLEKYQIGKIPNSQKPNLENPNTYKEKNIHKEKSIKEKEIKSPKSSKEDLNHTDFFDEFWNIYPRKESKKKSKDIFKKISKTKQQKIIALTKIFKADMEALGRTRTHILLPSSYLMQERYNDYTQNDELSKTNEGARNKGGNCESRAEILSKKIINCIQNYSNEGDDSALLRKVHECEAMFDNNELSILKELDYSFENFKDMEFKAGEIKRYLGGMIDG